MHRHFLYHKEYCQALGAESASQAWGTLSSPSNPAFESASTFQIASGLDLKPSFLVSYQLAPSKFDSYSIINSIFCNYFLYGQQKCRPVINAGRHRSVLYCYCCRTPFTISRCVPTRIGVHVTSVICASSVGLSTHVSSGSTTSISETL
ncbi:hypothetical protein SDC9_181007 [bioreactor metagenome]|uniref:Uncharacterized protein n=1 Tax=bioreactor metagenome TaxID=1076179 RepID=A0A645H608_9ZZZZ